MKKLFILEDDPKAMPIIEWIKKQNRFAVVHARTIEDAVYYLEYCEDAPIDSYDYFILDASVPGCTVASVSGEMLRFSDENDFNGLPLFDRYKEKFLQSNAKIAFMTAFSAMIKPRINSEDVTMIDKANDGFIEDISRFLN